MQNDVADDGLHPCREGERMRVLLVGGGGREHAIAWKLRQSSRLTALYCAPGNAGIAQIAQCVDIAATDIAGVVRFAKHEKIDLVIVAPDDPLAMGMVDALEKEGIRAFGPNQAAARIESSKVFSKDLMNKYGIPTAQYAVFDDVDRARAYLQTCTFPVVVKADGLALGKGVLICQNQEEAQKAIRTCMIDCAFGDSGKTIIIEEFMKGPEMSILAFADGNDIVPMISAQDHKRAFDGDQGPNTGGMGTFAPSPYMTPELEKTFREEIMWPTMTAMEKEGCPFSGVLYFGLMLTADGPKVLEYNARFGDPETQVVLPLLKTDLLDIMEAVVGKRLKNQQIEWRDGAAVCVVLASKGYPGSYPKGIPIDGLEAVEKAGKAVVFHAGTKMAENGRFETNGGRVLGVSALGNDLADAAKNAYAAVQMISFEGVHYRHDIAGKYLEHSE